MPKDIYSVLTKSHSTDTIVMRPCRAEEFSAWLVTFYFQLENYVNWVLSYLTIFSFITETSILQFSLFDVVTGTSKVNKNSIGIKIAMFNL